MIHLGERCAYCGAPAARTRGAIACCYPCAERRDAPLREHVLDRQGYLDGTEPGAGGAGRIFGRWRPDYGPTVYELRCERCGATWCGTPGDPCGWCIDLIAAIRTGQREMLLHVDLPGADDCRRRAALESWADRLARGVQAGLVTEAEVRMAWRREVGGHVGAA